MIFRFAVPWALALLPLAAVAAWALARRRRARDARVPLPQASLGASAWRTGWLQVDRALPWVRGLALALLVTALARPQAGVRITTVRSEGVDVVVALDASGSMAAEDFRPLNRLEVAKRTVAEFVRGRAGDRLGLVVFAGLATTRCPLTLDHAMLLDFLEDVGLAEDESGTALGMGLATAVSRLKDSPAKSKVVVLVTDGRNNRGQIGPEAAAELARTLGIRVYTIGVGTRGRAPVPVRGPTGLRYVMQRLDLDEPLLEKIASETGGRYFRATDPDGLREIFSTIDQLEKSEIQSRVRENYSERFQPFLAAAAALLLLEGALMGTRLRRTP